MPGPIASQTWSAEAKVTAAMVESDVGLLFPVWHTQTFYDGLVDAKGGPAAADGFLYTYTLTNGALVRAGALMAIEPGPAALAFAAVVVVTMVAALTFDTRRLWGDTFNADSA